MINLDMVGRLGEKDKNLEINGIGTAAEWSVILKNISIDNIRVKEGMNGIGPSDHTSFYLNNIPVLHFFTGQHEDYHKPTDDAAKINFEGMSKVCQYIIAVVMQLNSLPKLSYIKTKEDNNENTPKFKVTLGVIPDYMFDGEGMRIDGVTEGKAASKAGLIKGDIVTQLGELQVTDMSSYMKALSQFTKGQQTTVIFIRDREKKQSNITF
jgi:membrane-associated protease RseP (regulator of RpoE activity)